MTLSNASGTFNALIRTHHITSRKKVAKIKAAAQHETLCFLLIRSGGSPGLMYVEGAEQNVASWVETVQRLRYKDYQLVRRPAPIELAMEGESSPEISGLPRGYQEEESVKGFASQLESRGVLQWWRKAMGFAA